jgi:hypothetical protein
VNIDPALDSKTGSVGHHINLPFIIGCNMAAHLYYLVVFKPDITPDEQ